MPFPLMAAMAVADYLGKRQEAQAQKRQAAANILESNARSLGAPTYNVAGAEAANKIDEPGPADLAMGVAGVPGAAKGGAGASQLMQFMASKSAGADEDEPMPNAFAQDYANNPPMRQRRTPYGGGYGY